MPACSMRNHLRALNGSGKHNTTGLYRPTTGANLLDPDRDPRQRTLQFLLFPVRKRIKAESECLRRSAPRHSVQLPEMDHRLGGNEAAASNPCLMIFIGDESGSSFSILWKKIWSLRRKENQTMKPGAKVLPTRYQRYDRPATCSFSRLHFTRQ